MVGVACLIRPKAIWTIVTHIAKADKWGLFAHKAGEHASQDVLSFQGKGEACRMGEFDIPENQSLYLHARYFFFAHAVQDQTLNHGDRNRY